MAVINGSFRTIEAGARELALGCVGDAWTRKVDFTAPRYVDGVDTEGWRVRVHYANAEGDEDRAEVTDARWTDDALEFSWVPRPNAFASAGKVTAAVEVAELDGENVVVREYNTLPAAFFVSPTLETDPSGPRLVDEEGEYIVFRCDAGGEEGE